jgi:Polyketide cyclase / dehydrase and lipid transport
MGSAAQYFEVEAPVAQVYAYWRDFSHFPAFMPDVVEVTGTGVDDPPHPVPRVAGMPTSLLGAAATSLTAVAGWLLDRRSS